MWFFKSFPFSYNFPLHGLMLDNTLTKVRNARCQSSESAFASAVTMTKSTWCQCYKTFPLIRYWPSCRKSVAQCHKINLPFIQLPLCPLSFRQAFNKCASSKTRKDFLRTIDFNLRFLAVSEKLYLFGGLTKCHSIKW